MRQLLLIVGLAASCFAAPQLYRTVSGDLMYLRSDIPAVAKIPEPGIKLLTPGNIPSSVIVSQPTVLDALPTPVLKMVDPVNVFQSALEIPDVKIAVPDTPVVVTGPQPSVLDAVPTPVLKMTDPVNVFQPALEIPDVKSAVVVAPAQVPATLVATPADPVVLAPVPQVKSVAVVESAAPAVAVVEAPRPLDAPEPPMPSLSIPHEGGQFHAQDESGQYYFGHYGGPNTRVEKKDSLGRTSGSFAYVDPEGDVQVRKYAAAPGSGFRVAASDLVEDTPEVAEIKSAFTRAHEAAKTAKQGAVVVATA